jgi:hypothetical protein
MDPPKRPTAVRRLHELVHSRLTRQSTLHMPAVQGKSLNSKVEQPLVPTYIQGQIQMTYDPHAVFDEADPDKKCRTLPTGLVVLNAGPETSLVMKWIHAMVLPDGLYPIPAEKLNAERLSLPQALFTRVPGKRQDLRLTYVFMALKMLRDGASIDNVRSVTDYALSDEELEKLPEFYKRWRYRLLLPKDTPYVDWSFVEAEYGDLVLYNTLHGNAAWSLPTAAMYVDYVVDDHFPGEWTQERRAEWANWFEKHPDNLAYTSPKISSHERAYYETELGAGRVPEISDDVLTRQLIGFDPVDTAAALPYQIVTREDLNFLKTRGWVRIPMRERLRASIKKPKAEQKDAEAGTEPASRWDYAHYKVYLSYVEAARMSFGNYFNKVLLEGFHERSNQDWVLPVDDMADPVWQVLSSDKDAERLTNDAQLLLLEKKDPETDTWEHLPKTEGVKLDRLSGTGAATNCSRLSETLNLATYPAIASIFTQAYFGLNVSTMQRMTLNPSRWRVKPGAGALHTSRVPTVYFNKPHSDTGLDREVLEVYTSKYKKPPALLLASMKKQGYVEPPIVGSPSKKPKL